MNQKLVFDENTSKEQYIELFSKEVGYIFKVLESSFETVMRRIEDYSLGLYNVQVFPITPGTDLYTLCGPEHCIIVSSGVAELSDHLFNLQVQGLDYKLGKDFMRDRYHSTSLGACSVVRKGSLVGRNFDYPYDDRAYFLVKVPRHSGRFASIGICGGFKEVTKESLASKEAASLIEILPFATLDAMNENGVTASVLVVPTGDKGITTGTIPAVEKRDEICTIMLVRYIVDNFASAEAAVTYIRDYVSVYSPNKNYQQEVHFFIADRTSTYLMEFVDNEVKVTDLSENPWATNFYLDGVELNEDKTCPIPESSFQYGITDFAGGIERWNIIANSYAGITSIDRLRSLLKHLYYTNAYEESTTPLWKTDFAGDWTSEGYGVLKSYDAEENYLPLIRHSRDLYKEKVRDGKIWHTSHSIIYNLTNLSVSIITQQSPTEPIHFSLDV